MCGGVAGERSLHMRVWGACGACLVSRGECAYPSDLDLVRALAPRTRFNPAGVCVSACAHAYCSHCVRVWSVDNATIGHKTVRIKIIRPVTCYLKMLT